LTLQLFNQSAILPVVLSFGHTTVSSADCTLGRMAVSSLGRLTV